MASPRERGLIIARQQIDTEIDSAVDTINQLLITRNEQSLINAMLPPEILGLIFIHAATDGPVSASKPDRWLHITQVCVKWRDIAHKLTPRLWSTIWAADTHPSLLHAMLARSGETPLQLIVSAAGTETRLPERCLANMALLMQQRERIKALRMIGPYAEPAVAFLNTQYRSGLPLDKVEHLRLSGPAVQPDSAHLQPQPLELLGMSPSLIQLRDVSIVPHPALLGNLKEFRSRAGLHWTLSQLISALDSMPRLEALSLEFPFRSPDTSPNVSDDAPDRHVLLPRLSTLKFIGHDADSVAFFSHVRMPLQAEVVLEVPTIVGLPLSPWFGRHVDLLSVDFCPESTIGLEIRFQAGLFPSPTIPGFGPTLSSNSAKLQIRKSFSEMIGDVIGFFAACDFTGVEALNITLRVEPNMERPGVKQLFQAVREHFPSLQQLLVVGATGEQVMHLVRTSDREPEVPFLHLTSLFVECHELQKQHPSGKGVAKLHYLVKDVADCFKSRWVQHQTAALENLAINGERIDPAVLDFYASYTCGTVNVQGDFGVPDVCHDVNALQAFLSSANLSL